MLKHAFLQGVWRFRRSQAEGACVTSAHDSEALSPVNCPGGQHFTGITVTNISGMQPVLRGSPGRGLLRLTPRCPWTFPLGLFLSWTWLCILHRKKPQL